MKRAVFFAGLLFCCGASAQQLYDGGFEQTNSPPCGLNLSNATFNGAMLHTTAFGTASQVDMLSNFGNCGFGISCEGDWFLGLGVDVTNTKEDAIALELTAPLVTGNDYKITFFEKSASGYPANNIKVGISGSSNVFGSQVYATTTLPDTSWRKDSVQFTAFLAATYITVQAIAGAYGWNHIDRFAIQAAPSSIQKGTAASEISLFPVPASDRVYINGASSKQLSVAVLDVLGRIQLQTNARMQPGKPLELDVSQLEEGVYFVVMDDALVSRLLIKR